MLHKGKIPLDPFFSGDLQREDSLRMAGPLLPLLSALPAFLAPAPGWKKSSNWGCGSAELGGIHAGRFVLEEFIHEDLSRRNSPRRLGWKRGGSPKE